MDIKGQCIYSGLADLTLAVPISAAILNGLLRFFDTKFMSPSPLLDITTNGAMGDCCK